MRNAAEKMRRDKLNTHISELSSLVPMCVGSSKKMDKTSILRLSATYLRMNKTLKPDKNWNRMPRILESINLSQYLLEDMEGIFLVASSSGKIIFISHTIEKYLGYSQVEQLGQSLFSICHVEDHDTLRKALTPDDGFPTFCNNDQQDDSSTSDTNTTSSSSTQSSPLPLSNDPPSSTSYELATSYPTERQRRSFYIRLSQRSASRSEQPQYEHFYFVGDLRVPSKLEVHTAHTRSRRHKEHSFNSNEIVLVAFGRRHKEKHVSDVCLLESMKEEYITRHEPSGKMTYVDHRIAVVAGYMSAEVTGLSAFNFMHKEDVAWTMVALKRMFDFGEGFGWSVYRLRTKNGEYIYLRTCGYLEFDKDTKCIESFVCVNSLLPKEEGERGVVEMRKRYSPQLQKTHRIKLSPTENKEIEVPSVMAQIVANGPDSEETFKAAIREMISGLYMSNHRLSPKSHNSGNIETIVSSTTETVQQNRPTVLREVTSTSIRVHNGSMKRPNEEQKRNGRDKVRRRESVNSQLQIEVPPPMSPESIYMRVGGSVLRSPALDGSEVLSLTLRQDNDVTDVGCMEMDPNVKIEIHSPHEQILPLYQPLLTSWGEEPPGLGGGGNEPPLEEPCQLHIDTRLETQVTRPEVVQPPIKGTRKHSKQLIKTAQQVQQELNHRNININNMHNIGV